MVRLGATSLKLPIPIPVSRAIIKLGRDLSLARRRRRLSQASLAERMGVSLATVKRLEHGDPRVAIEIVARALHVLGEIDRIDKLLETSDDALGLALMDEQLPQRVRARKTSGAM
jgi:transcriptional regulator with XRE-family HTH domain